MGKLLQLQQIVPSKTCLSCDVCCRFLDQDSFLAPIFTKAEVQQLTTNGVETSRLFRPMADGQSARIKLKPHGEMYICPFFEPDTSECAIYPNRPLDCRIYPFALMYNADETEVVLGVDTICPFAEVELQTKSFQGYINHIETYIESERIARIIAANWSLIGPYQESAIIVAVLRKLSRALADRKLRGEN